MSRVTIQLAYEGPAVATGSMDARELAPALLALSDTLEDANRVLNGDRAGVNVLVHSDFRTGSFEVVFDLVQNLAETTKTLLSIETVYDAETIATLIGLTTGSSISLIKFIKWLRGRKIKKATTIDNGRVRIETDGDYDAIEISEETVRLYRDKRLRRSFVGLLTPLTRIGIERLDLREGNNSIESVSKPEATYFEVPESADEQIISSTRRSAFNVIGVFFEGGLKWKLFDGESKLSAMISDKNFLAELDKGNVSFTKGDILEVDLKTTQWTTDKGLKTEHEVIRVIKQHKRGTQLPLPFEGKESNE